MTTEQKIIEKQKELIIHDSRYSGSRKWYNEQTTLKNELSALEKEAEQKESVSNIVDIADKQCEGCNVPVPCNFECLPKSENNDWLEERIDTCVEKSEPALSAEENPNITNAKELLKAKGIKDTLYNGGVWTKGALSDLLEEYRQAGIREEMTGLLLHSPTLVDILIGNGLTPSDYIDEYLNKSKK